MARLARVVVPGCPHHVTQRGNRRQPTFFSDADYGAYVALMAECCAKHGLAMWAWCLMPNHVHLVAVPETAATLSRALAEAHRRYTRLVNFREGWRGYLWQGRFASCPMDGPYALAAARYVERNPVRAGLVRQAWDWPWSSAAAHVAGRGDALVKAGGPLVAEVNDWRQFLRGEADAAVVEALRRHGRTGRPLGSLEFVLETEAQLGRPLRRQRPGPRPKDKAKGRIK